MIAPRWIALGIVLIGVLGRPICGQVQWQRLGSAPIGGSAVVGAYDSLRDRLVMYLGQTVEYDGATWMARSPTQSPRGVGSCMVYDSLRQHCVILTEWSETWTWDGTNWTLAATTGPSGTSMSAMAWNDARGTVMLFGGSNGPTTDLWEWDGVRWSLIPTSNSPVGWPTHFYSTLAYDPSRDVLVSFGALQAPPNPPPSGSALAVTWEWDAQNGWRTVPAGGPTMFYRELVFDPARRRLVLFGRNDQYQPFESWEREGAGPWVQRTTSTTPPGILLGPAIHDSRRGRTLLIDYYANLYAYSPTLAARYDAHGVGCTGSLGVPTMANTLPWSLPWLAGTLDATLENLPQSVALVTLGFSDASFGPYLLPIDVGFLGMPSCFLRSAPDACVLVMGSGNRARFSLSVPSQNALRGMTFYQQALVPDPGMNRLGGVLSNSVEGVIGTK